eukprot:TRINITY_DN121_c0_g1_i6.p1 TRINITY_DN121_c0_g1~~TRINITY_DN121_c0_g1_i6.p1  ORF type:complete len:432 (-),score=119.71 TRINITY_DN121_c0_g1_i6:902-2197(-)
MNVSQIKAFMGDQKVDEKASVHPNEAIKKQLQQEGLQQAAEFTKQHSATVTVNSTQTSIGLKVFSGSLSQNVVVDGKRPNESKQSDGGEENKSLFDFEKVARNVLGFVSGVIQGAADGGADDETLNGLFSQAREGVSRGFAMAEKDLAGFMNDDIEEGVSRSRTLIDDGIDDLEQNIFNPNAVGLSGLNAVSASDAKTGSLLIRTKDGDEVTLSFESIKQFSAASQASLYVSTGNESDVSGSGSRSIVSQQASAYEYYERSGISFSIKGDIDEDEMTAIADLVEQAQDLADTFYSGDLDKAFEQALNLGFDDKELVGYALQLNRTSQTEMVKAYENIKHYSEDSEAENQYGNIVSPIAQYLEKMMSTFENAQNTLGSGDDYNSLVAGIISEMEDVQIPDLISAINRFRSFNQTLLDAMPQQAQSEESTQSN